MTDELSTTASGRATVQTADGIRLVVEQFVPANPRGAASIAHPHPQYGGTMDDAVVMTLWRALVALDIATVRFSFRGFGGSTGTHGGGEPEREDVRAALERAAALAPDRPVLACGYSFGADVTLAVDHPRVGAWLVVAPPLRMFDASAFVAAHDPRPKFLFVGAHDQVAPPAVIHERTEDWAATTVHVIDMADHFFRGSLDRLAAQFTDAVQSLL